MHPLKGRKQTKEHIANRVAAGAGRPRNTDEVLWSKVDRRGKKECWPWIGSVNRGYGRTEINDRSYYAHRVIFCLVHPGIVDLEGPDMNDFGFVLHRCNNRLCCNPAHLYVGTQRDNMRDRLKTGDGYRNLPKGENHHASVLSDADRTLLLEMVDQGVAARDLAQIFKVNRNTVKSIIYWHKRNASA